METDKRFYTYAYLREDGTPYYIGKGSGRRVYKKHSVFIPPENRIIFLKKNISEEEAYKHEIYMIAIFGRKDLGTGILRNKTDGGDGTRGMLLSELQRQKISQRQRGENNYWYGRKHTEETRQKMSKAQTGEKHAMYGKKHRLESREKISKSIRGEKHPLYQKGHSKESKIKMKESFKKLYKVTYTDGTYEIIKGFEEWLKNNNLSCYFIKKLRDGVITEYKNIVLVEKLSHPKNLSI